MTHPNTGKVPLPEPPDGMEWDEGSGGGSVKTGIFNVTFRLRPIVPATPEEHEDMETLTRSRDGWMADALRESKNAAYWRAKYEATQPAVPATVMVEMARTLADRIVANKDANYNELVWAVRAAIVRRWVCDSFVCTEDYEHGCRTIAHNRKVCDLVDSGHHHMARKPCPVMVCPVSLKGTFDQRCYGDHWDRRPCKHKDGEGHEKDGSAHE